MTEDERPLSIRAWVKMETILQPDSGQSIAYKDSREAGSEKSSLKFKEERMVARFLEYPNQVYKQRKLIWEKNLLQMCVEVDGQKQESEMPTANIQDLKEEYFRGEGHFRC